MKSHTLLLAFLVLFTILIPCVTAESWTRVQCPLIDRSIQNRFEQIKTLVDFQGTLGTLKTINGPQQAKASLTLDIETFPQPVPRIDFEFTKWSGVQVC